MTATTTPTIEEILDEFLDQQEARLSPATFRKYASTVELLWMHLNGYGHEGLSEAEAKRFERAFEDGDEEAFCHLFGPEKIVEQIPRFLYWFVLRKVMARESELRRRQHLAQARALARRAELRRPRGRGARARGGGLGARRPARGGQAIDALARPHGRDVRPQAAAGGRARGRGLPDDRARRARSAVFEDGLGPVDVPDAAAELAKPGWRLWGALACENGRWRLLEHGIVYP